LEKKLLRADLGVLGGELNLVVAVEFLLFLFN
jgi:hypothetical protein